MRPSALLSAVCLATCPVLCASGQDLQEIADRTRRVEIPGVSVLPPQGAGWLVFPVGPTERIVPEALIRFVQRVPSTPASPHQVFAGVLVLDSGDTRTLEPAAFLEDFTAGVKEEIGQMLTARQRLVGFDAALDLSHGATCVRYSRTTEITGQFPGTAAVFGISSTLGLFCAHPSWPRYRVDITYQQNYAKGQEPLARDREAEEYLASVVFTSNRPIASFQP